MTRRDQKERLSTLVRWNTPIVRAFYLKEVFQLFWEYKQPARAKALRGGAAAPVLEQALWISGMHGGQILPLLFFVRDYASHPFRDQVILRVEVAVERHLVRLRRFGNRFDADAPNALLMKQVPCRHENPLANGNRGAALFSRLTVAVNICLHDTFYPSLTRMLPVGNIGAGAECYRSVTYYMSIRSATRVRSTGHQPGSRAT